MSIVAKEVVDAVHSCSSAHYSAVLAQARGLIGIIGGICRQFSAIILANLLPHGKVVALFAVALTVRPRRVRLFDGEAAADPAGNGARALPADRVRSLLRVADGALLGAVEGDLTFGQAVRRGCRVRYLLRC